MVNILNYGCGGIDLIPNTTKDNYPQKIERIAKTKINPVIKFQPKNINSKIAQTTKLKVKTKLKIADKIAPITYSSKFR